MYSPKDLMLGIIQSMKRDYPLIAMSKDITHDFLGWGLKKAFSDLTGFRADGFVDNPVCQEIYRSYRYDFEHYMFAIINDIGARHLTGDLRYSFTLTYERLYIVAY